MNFDIKILIKLKKDFIKYNTDVTTSYCLKKNLNYY